MSLVSGNSAAKKDLLIALLVVFLLVIPLIVLGIIAFLNRHRLIKWWKLLPSFKYRYESLANRENDFDSGHDARLLVSSGT